MALSAKGKKIVVAVGVVAVLGAVVALSTTLRRQDLVSVESGKVERRPELVAVVTATGEIKPKNYVELQAEISGVITELFVKEGDLVQKGSLLLKIDPVQTEADAKAQAAVLAATQAEVRNQEAQIAIQRTNVDRELASVRVAEVELERARQNHALAKATFERKQGLYEDNLISQDAYEAAKNDLVNAETALETARVRLEQAKAQYQVSKVVLEQAEIALEGARSRVKQQQAFLQRSHDLLSKTVIRSPLDGVITQLNVEVGERAVPGTLNNPAATLMVIADLSVIEAELKVDETDIVDLALGQPAVVKVDALPNTPLKGTVTEIGNSAIPTATSQEAKDFKVIVQLEDPPAVLRPGLSCTGEITTATRQNVLAIPIQALTMREFETDESGGLLRKKPQEKGGPEKVSADSQSGPRGPGRKKEFEGVFKVVDGKAVFVEVKTGILGSTEIEVLSGLEEGDTIVTGSYKTLRTLADGDAVKIEKSGQS
ncbi:MAG: efflux RND transporter periplasmic adaptor subunit [Acidobacteriota bacterium]